MAYGRTHKYHAKKVIGEDGQVYDSTREYKRALYLQQMEKDGLISKLHRQVPFELIPKQLDEDGHVIERACKYVADFVYADENNRLVVEDVKGFRTPEYIIKRKILLEKFGIRINEV